MTTFFLVLMLFYSSVLRYRLRTAERLLVTDPLTRVYNRRWFEQRSTKLHGFCSVLYFDIDDFKKINDTLGHSEGDRVLQKFCDAINSRKRNTDTLIRLGGDEFALIATAVDELGADRLLDQFELALGAAGVSVTVGIATAHDCVCLTNLVSCAEKQMREKKITRKVGR